MSSPNIWRNIQHRFNFCGFRCKECNLLHFPYSTICPRCLSKETERHYFIGNGEVVSYTQVFDPPIGMDHLVPYTVVMVDLEEGVKMSGQLVGIPYEKVKKGMKVQIAFRKISERDEAGIIEYGFKFRPVD